MTEHLQDKGPFKGKGALGLDISEFAAIEEWQQLVSAFHNLRDAQDRIVDLERFRSKLREMADHTITSFNNAYPSARLRLVKSPDRSNTYLRWRLLNRELSNPRTELDSEHAKLILESLPANVARDWFRFEEYRIQINYYMALVVYEFHRTNDHVDRLIALRKLRQKYSLKEPSKSRDKT